MSKQRQQSAQITHSSLVSVPVSLPMTWTRSTDGGTLQASSPIGVMRSMRPVPCTTKHTPTQQQHMGVRRRMHGLQAFKSRQGGLTACACRVGLWQDCRAGVRVGWRRESQQHLCHLHSPLWRDRTPLEPVGSKGGKGRKQQKT